jgi:hypothetical protein
MPGQWGRQSEMNKPVPAFLSAAVEEVVNLAKLPGGRLLGVAIEQLFRHRVEVARDILLDELRGGDKTLAAAEIEEVAAILYRYMRAAQEGGARLNLRLMAKVIAGQAHRGNLLADEFLYYADMLASLRREEVLVLGTLYRHWQSDSVQRAEENTRPDAAMTAAKEELIPNIFRDEEEFLATLEAATRTGLVTYISGFGRVYRVSPLMNRLYALAPLEAAVKAEPTA